jgi:hypothetical protein
MPEHESMISVTQGSGTADKSLHTLWRPDVGGNAIEEQAVVLGEQYLKTYSVHFYDISVATTAAHIVQIWNPASNVRSRVRRIHLTQGDPASAASILVVTVQRITSVGSGGTSVTPQAFDPDDGGSGMSAMTLPSSKGTEGDILWHFAIPMVAAAPYSFPGYTWRQLPHQQPLVIDWDADGIVLKVNTGITSATVDGFVEIVQTTDTF